jgi:uncharacterized OsmC-like protein
MINATQATVSKTNDINGVNVTQIMEVIGNIERNENYGKSQFRARNSWVNGGINCSEIKEFRACCKEDISRDQSFKLANDEPLFLAGEDKAPNPVEYILHALAGCLTTTMVYHAAVQGIEIEAVESTYEGDIDLRGIFGISDKVRKGYNAVRVNMKVKSQASVEQLTALAMFSPVYDIISKSLPVEFVLETH